MRVGASIASILAQANQEPEQKARSTELSSREDFLFLLVQQLRNQDPLNPLEAQEFAAQLAQFTQVEQLIQLNEKSDVSTTATNSLAQLIRNTQATNMIGKLVKVEGSAFIYQAETEQPIGFLLGGDSSNVTVTIKNEGGVVINEINAGRLEMGDQIIVWQGAGSEGTPQPSGRYTFTVHANNEAGQTVPVTTYIHGLINGVRYHQDEAKLLIDNEEIDLNQIMEVFLTSDFNNQP